MAINSQGYPGPVPTGMVQFMVDGNAYGMPVPLTDGQATSTPPDSTLVAGSHTVAASYSGDNSYAAGSGSLLGGQTITGQTGQVNDVDFETGDFSQAASHVGGAIVTSPALDGTYSLQLQRSGSVANCEIRQSGTTYYNVPTAYYRFLFETTSNPGEGGMVNFQDSASGFKAALHLSGANKLLFYNSAGTPVATGTTTLISGQIYAISAMIGTGSNAAWEIRINGTVEMSGTTNLGTLNNGSLKLGGNGAYKATYYYDDVAIDSQTYPGEGGLARAGSLLVSPLSMLPQFLSPEPLPVQSLPFLAKRVIEPQTAPVFVPSQPLPVPADQGLMRSMAGSAATRRAIAALDLLFADWSIRSRF